jgi:hypothetical protein
LDRKKRKELADEDPPETAKLSPVDDFVTSELPFVSGKLPELQPISFVLSSLAEWRWLTTRSPQGMPVLQTPPGYEFGIEADQRKIRDALRRGELHAYVPTDPPLALDSALWAQDWAWRGVVRKAQFFARTEDGAEFAFKPHVKTREIDAFLERTQSLKPLIIPQPVTQRTTSEDTKAHSQPQTQSQSRQPLLPPYLAFMIWVSRQLALSARANVYRRSDFRRWLKDNWPAEIASPSDRKLKMMTVLLGYPEDEVGGRPANRPSALPEIQNRPTLSEIGIERDEHHPPFLAFMIEVWNVQRPQGRFPKTDFQERLKANWRDHLGPAHQEKLEAIAMFLGDPAHERGGNLPASAIRIFEQK